MNYKTPPCGTLTMKENLVEIPKIQLAENQDSRPWPGEFGLVVILDVMNRNKWSLLALMDFWPLDCNRLILCFI